MLRKLLFILFIPVALQAAWDELFPGSKDPTHITLEVPIAALLEVPHDAKLLAFKTLIDEVEVDWLIYCGHFDKLQFTPEEFQIGKVNILDHFAELMPRRGATIGLISFQNGIRNSFDDWSKMGESLIGKIPEGTLVLSIHNATEGAFRDLHRLKKERANTEETPIVFFTRQFFAAILEPLHKVNPEMLWLHIPHSEGSAIFRRSVEGMTPEQQTLLQQHLYLLALAPALPVPEDYALYAVNIYSEKDSLVIRYARPHLEDTDYDIRIIPCDAYFWDPNYYVDHAFHGKTYQRSLDTHIDILRAKWGFYDGENH